MLTVLVVLIVIDVVSLVVFFKLLSNYPVHHFDEVIPGVLYRSAQPDPERWKVLRDQYHIHTVVNFRYDDPGDEGMMFEKQFCKDNNIKLIRIALDDAPPTEKELTEFLNIVKNPANQPVLVHCELGRSRTGVMVAAYRIKCDGWTAAKAIEESKHFKQNIRPVYVDYLNKIASQSANPDK
ncbi:MAG TPA: dual specificity protein phosphatase family protein [Phycisphaerae bacterium]|nr:dual specificity protein phosphatase family protein [Phycisphaerae bacterium]HPS52174.1 dual specificity protein phosphatase family protein [Phycisphaerae bacterium]